MRASDAERRLQKEMIAHIRSGGAVIFHADIGIMDGQIDLRAEGDRKLLVVANTFRADVTQKFMSVDYGTKQQDGIRA